MEREREREEKTERAAQRETVEVGFRSSIITKGLEVEGISQRLPFLLITYRRTQVSRGLRSFSTNLGGSRMFLYLRRGANQQGGDSVL